MIYEKLISGIYAGHEATKVKLFENENWIGNFLIVYPNDLDEKVWVYQEGTEGIVHKFKNFYEVASVVLSNRVR